MRKYVFNIFGVLLVALSWSDCKSQELDSSNFVDVVLALNQNDTINDYLTEYFEDDCQVNVLKIDSIFKRKYTAFEFEENGCNVLFAKNDKFFDLFASVVLSINKWAVVEEGVIEVEIETKSIAIDKNRHYILGSVRLMKTQDYWEIVEIDIEEK